MTVKVSPKFQVVIPKAVRRELGLQSGTPVSVIAMDGIAYIVPIPSIKAIQERLRGKLNAKNLRDKKDRI